MGTSRAVSTGDKRELVGVIIDPNEPSRIIPAVGAVSPVGGSFARYRYVTPEPLIVAAPTTPAPQAAADDTAQQLAKGFLKRGR
jgi:hypothetical protein